MVVTLDNQISQALETRLKSDGTFIFRGFGMKEGELGPHGNGDMGGRSADLHTHEGGGSQIPLLCSMDQ